MTESERYTVSIVMDYSRDQIGATNDLQEAVNKAIHASNDKELALKYAGVNATICVCDMVTLDIPLKAKFRKEAK